MFCEGDSGLQDFNRGAFRDVGFLASSKICLVCFGNNSLVSFGNGRLDRLFFQGFVENSRLTAGDALER